MNDLGRSERLSTEIEMVSRELTGSSGLGGRARTASRSEERARGLVGKNVRSMVEETALEHPALGRHLAGAISKGNFCVYQQTRPPCLLGTLIGPSRFAVICSPPIAHKFPPIALCSLLFSRLI